MELVAELHRRQQEMYAGGSIDSVVELLAGDIVWHVPGRSPIAGDHRGVGEVIAYFERRRQLANTTMQMHPGKVIVAGDAVAQFVEGSATLDGQRVSWQTFDIYRVDTEHRWIREAWLVPLDDEHVAPEGGFDLEPYPAVRRWLERVAARPGIIPITA